MTMNAQTQPTKKHFKPLPADRLKHTRQFNDLIEAYEPLSQGGYRARAYIDDAFESFISERGALRELRFE